MGGEPRLIELGLFVAHWLVRQYIVLVYSMNTDTISMLYSRDLGFESRKELLVFGLFSPQHSVLLSTLDVSYPYTNVIGVIVY